MGLSLEYAGETLKKDKDIVEKAVVQNGLALEYAGETLKKDKDIVKKAVVQNGLSLKFTSLTELDLWNNNGKNIGHEGAKSIGEGLKENNTLTELYLEGNNI